MIHTTKEGKQIPIVLMVDSHLINFIKLLFKGYGTSNNPDKLTEYALGVKPKEMTPSIFYTIVKNYFIYILEGLRRDSCRKQVFEILSMYNPVFSSNGSLSEKINQKALSSVIETYDDEEDILEYDSQD